LDEKHLFIFLLQYLFISIVCAKILCVYWALGFKRPYNLPFQLRIIVALAVVVVVAAAVLVVFVVVAAFVVAVVVEAIVVVVHESIFLDHRRLDCFQGLRLDRCPIPKIHCSDQIQNLLNVFWHKCTLAVPGIFFNVMAAHDFLLLQITNKSNLTFHT
jgi:hypothetical protein